MNHIKFNVIRRLSERLKQVLVHERNERNVTVSNMLNVLAKLKYCSYFMTFSSACESNSIYL